MSFERSLFAGMPTHEFVKHLEKHGLQPTPEEQQSIPANHEKGYGESIAHTILETTGQRFGDPVGHSSAK